MRLLKSIVTAFVLFSALVGYSFVDAEASVVQTTSVSTKCDQVLATDYFSAIAELVSGNVKLEKMKVEGVTRTHRKTLEKALSEKRQELIQVLGEARFNKQFGAAKIRAAESSKIKDNNTRTLRRENLIHEQETLRPFVAVNTVEGATQITPDSRYFISYSEKEVLLHHGWTGEIANRFQFGALQFVAKKISPDSEMFAALTVDVNNEIYLIIWFLKTGELRKIKFANNRVRWIEFSPDSQSIASLSKDGRVDILDLKSGEFKYKFQTTDGESELERTMLFSPDGLRLLTTVAYGTTESNSVEIWDIKAEHSAGLALQSQPRAIHTKWNPDGTKVLIHNVSNNHSEVWHLGDNSIVPLQDRGFEPTWNTDGKKVIAVDHSGVVREWNSNTGRSRKKFKLEGVSASGLNQLAWFLEIGKMLGKDIDDNYFFWDIESGQLQEKWKFEKGLLQLSPDGQFFTLRHWTKRPVLTEIFTRRVIDNHGDDE